MLLRRSFISSLRMFSCCVFQLLRVMDFVMFVSLNFLGSIIHSSTSGLVFKVSAMAAANCSPDLSRVSFRE